LHWRKKSDHDGLLPRGADDIYAGEGEGRIVFARGSAAARLVLWSWTEKAPWTAADATPAGEEVWRIYFARLCGAFAPGLEVIRPCEKCHEEN